MIGKLTGILDSTKENSAIIDVGGVGYVVFCSGRTLQQLPEKGSEVQLLIETHVREDHIHLYGFLTANEQEWFLILNNVQGVGTKMALAILSVLSPSELIAALVAQDKAAFKQISGVGPKLAERIITELKSKVKSIDVESLAPNISNISPQSSVKTSGALGEAVSALINLGYSRSDAYNVINRIANENKEMKTEELIRNGLKELGR